MSTVFTYFDPTDATTSSSSNPYLPGAELNEVQTNDYADLEYLHTTPDDFDNDYVNLDGADSIDEDLHNASSYKVKLNCRGKSSFIQPTFWYKKYEQDCISTKIFSSRVIAILTTALYTLWLPLKNVPYKYAVSKFFKSIKNVQEGRKVKRSLFRIAGTILFGAAAVFCCHLIFPLAALGVIATTALGVPLYLAKYIGFMFTGLLIGTLATKLTSRTYAYSRHGITNPEKYHVDMAAKQKFADAGLDNTAVENLEKTLIKKLNEYRILGIKNPLKSDKRDFYKEVFMHLKNGDVPYIAKFLETKHERKQQKVRKLAEQCKSTALLKSKGLFSSAKNVQQKLADKTEALESFREAFFDCTAALVS